MPKKGASQGLKPLGDMRDTGSMGALAEEYLIWLAVRNYSPKTIQNRRLYLGYFLTWCRERSLIKPAEITKPILERYQRHLYHHRKKDGKALSFRSQHTRLVPVRAYFKWLTRQNFILYNPASELELPKLEHRLPKAILTRTEAEAVLAECDTNESLGIRDRAILETFYSTGMRRMELVGLSLYSIDTERGTILIRQGKGKKDRMIPIGERALKWVQRYLDDVRPKLVMEPDEGILFLSSLGEGFTLGRMSQLVRKYVTTADLGKKGSCHLFRHTMATLMLENGADIRFIQAMLGHACLDTTQIYTQVSIQKLKEIHTATHPARAQKSLKLAEMDDRDEILADLADEIEEDKSGVVESGEGV